MDEPSKKKTEDNVLSALRDRERLDAIERSRFLSDVNGTKWDHVTALICEALSAPVALVSIVTDDRQIFPSAQGLPIPWDTKAETPLSHSFCQYVVASELPLQVVEAETHELVCDNLAITDLGVKAYLGTPIRDPDGAILGSLCAIDTETHEWTTKDLNLLKGFSASITTQLLADRVIANLHTANQELAAERARLNRVSQNASVFIAELSPDLVYTFSNTSYAALYKTSLNNIVGKRPYDIMSKKTFSVAQPYLEAAQRGKKVTYEVELQMDGGTSRIMRVHYMPDKDEYGNVLGIAVLKVDVTEQHVLTKAAASLEARLNAAHQMSPDGFMVFKSCRDDAGQIVDFEWEYVNDAGAAITERPVDELIGNRMLDVLPGNKQTDLFDAYIDVVETGDPFKQTTHYDHDGISLWVSISAIKLNDGFAVSFRDVTKRKNIELQLGENSIRLQRILDNVVALIGVLSPEGRLTDANQPALDIAGLSRDDVIGKLFWDTYWWNHSEDTRSRLKKAYDEAITGKASRYDAQVRISETERFWIDFQMSPQFDENNSIVEIIVSGADITQRKLAENHRLLLVNELNHRVKNSLATIQAMARQTLRTAESLSNFEETFSARLTAIATAHNILMGSDAARADMRTMIDGQVGPYVDQTDQLKVTGDLITLDGECAHSVGLVLHELATNAAKYGALSNATGRVEITFDDIGDGDVRLVWTETGGPPVTPPSRIGFGSRLIKQSIEHTLGGSAEIDYAEHGIVATLVLPKEYDHG